MLKLTVLWAITILFILNSIAVTIRSSVTVGTLILWGLSGMLVLYCVFHKQINAFMQHGFGRVLKYCFFAGAALFMCLFIFVAVSGYSHTAQGDERAIIVLGAGLRGENVSDVLRRRLDAALTAWQQNPTAYVVVTGGQGPHEMIPEALAMQRWLLEHGVPPDKIILEDKSTSTEENLAFALVLLEKQGIAADEPIAIATNAFHIFRSEQYAKKVGFTDVRSIPASMNKITLLPSYFREVVAIVHFWIFKQ